MILYRVVLLYPEFISRVLIYLTAPLGIRWMKNVFSKTQIYGIRIAVQSAVQIIPRKKNPPSTKYALEIHPLTHKYGWIDVKITTTLTNPVQRRYANPVKCAHKYMVIIMLF